MPIGRGRSALMSSSIPAAQRKLVKGTIFGYRVRKHVGDGAWSRVY